MAGSVSRIDWILVDTIIIILLFVLLISVKIFKSTHRWRQSYSNEDLEFYSYPTASNLFKGEVLKTKKWSLTRNTSLLTETRNPKPIMLLGGFYKRKLIKVLSEGLASYGFSVINVKIGVKQRASSNRLRGLITDELQSLISVAFNFFKKDNLVENSEILIIDCSRALIPLEAYFKERLNAKIILINPKISEKNLKEQRDLKNDIQNIFYIFSQKRFHFLKNRSLNKIYKYHPKENLALFKITVLDKSNRNFKYHETILLGLIIDKLNNN
jgi:hypothetical protein